MLTVVSDSADRDGSGAARSAASSVIDELVREGAQRMLAEALRAEVEAYIAQFADVRDEKGHRLVVRNGCHESRTVTTSAGAVDVTAPRVNDKRVDPDTGERQRFSSSILPPWARKTPKIGEVLPLLYLHGLSSGDFVPALGQFLGSARGCPPRRSPSSPRRGRPSSRRSPSGTSRVWTSCTCGLTASMSMCASTTRSCACW